MLHIFIVSKNVLKISREKFGEKPESNNMLQIMKFRFCTFFSFKTIIWWQPPGFLMNFRTLNSLDNKIWDFLFIFIMVGFTVHQKKNIFHLGMWTMVFVIVVMGQMNGKNYHQSDSFTLKNTLQRILVHVL